MILNKDVHFEERMMCILNKYKHTPSLRYCFRIGFD